MKYVPGLQLFPANMDWKSLKLDNNLPKDNFVVDGLYSEDSDDNYEEYLPYFDKNKYFNLKKKYANS